MADIEWEDLNRKTEPKSPSESEPIIQPRKRSENALEDLGLETTLGSDYARVTKDVLRALTDEEVPRFINALRDSVAQTQGVDFDNKLSAFIFKTDMMEEIENMRRHLHQKFPDQDFAVGLAMRLSLGESGNQLIGALFDVDDIEKYLSSDAAEDVEEPEEDPELSEGVYEDMVTEAESKIDVDKLPKKRNAAALKEIADDYFEDYDLSIQVPKFLRELPNEQVPAFLEVYKRAIAELTSPEFLTKIAAVPGNLDRAALVEGIAAQLGENYPGQDFIIKFAIATTFSHRMYTPLTGARLRALDVEKYLTWDKKDYQAEFDTDFEIEAVEDKGYYGQFLGFRIFINGESALSFKLEEEVTVNQIKLIAEVAESLHEQTQIKASAVLSRLKSIMRNATKRAQLLDFVKSGDREGVKSLLTN